MTIEQYETNLKPSLYKLWNRISSGSYLPKSVRLVLNEEKTKIVYCKDNRRRGYHDQILFDFLGYSFRPRKTMNKAQHKVMMGLNVTLAQWAKAKYKHFRRKPWIVVYKLYPKCTTGYMNRYIDCWGSFLGDWIRCFSFLFVYRNSSFLLSFFRI